ncbi:MAG: preprotein translocase subunit YajC [Oscillospiraceae bacterium]|nr:preprotein translocase subunit YajC [Oscillospiraceae bacterium]
MQFGGLVRMELFVTTILPLILVVAVFYFLMIRPENKRKKQAEEMRNSLTVGDEITTIGGVVGTICAVKENTIVMETGADRVRIEFTKWAISNKGVQSAETTK